MGGLIGVYCKSVVCGFLGGSVADFLVKNKRNKNYSYKMYHSVINDFL